MESREGKDSSQLPEKKSKAEMESKEEMGIATSTAKLDMHEAKPAKCRGNTAGKTQKENPYHCMPSTSRGLRTNSESKSKKSSDLFGLSDSESSVAPASTTSEGSDEDGSVHLMSRSYASLKYGRVTKCQDMIIFGPNGTSIPEDSFVKLKFSNLSKLVFSLLRLVFGKTVLATHSLSGRKHYHAPGQPDKKQLDPGKVEDIIFIATSIGGYVERDIRGSITFNCLYAASKKKKKRPKRTYFRYR